MERTVTGLFDSYDQAAQAVARLARIGVAQDKISLVSGQTEHRVGSSAPTLHATEAGLATGSVLGGGAGLLAGLGLIAIPGVGPIVAAGWLVATLAGAGVGAAAGGLAGALMGLGVSQDQANLYAEGVRTGGTIVSALVEDDLVAQARIILGLGDLHRISDPEAGAAAVRTPVSPATGRFAATAAGRPVPPVADQRAPRGRV